MPIKGIINLPGDKSISHRALMLASLAEGECVIHNLSTGDDVETTRNCLSQCGILSSNDGETVRISGGSFMNPKTPLNCGNSGTSVRLLVGLLAGQGISAQFTGDSSLSKRPMNRIIDPLTQMGVHFKSNDACLPISMSLNNLNSITYSPPVASAQVKSAILLVGLGIEGETIVHETIKTRDHTEIMLTEIGANLTVGEKISIRKLDKPLQKFELTVPGDPSSAAFFGAAAAMIPNSDITIKNILANPTRIGFFSILEKMGAGLEYNNMRKECGEWVGDIHIYSQPLNGIDITREIVPSIIDELPIIAVLASQADSPTTVCGAEELRVKESDRINAICLNLSSMGCEVIEKQDGFIIIPGNRISQTRIKTFNDHRIAMAFTIAGLLTHERNILDNESCINISFPEFNTILDKVQR